jgi:hypothetical protein
VIRLIMVVPFVALADSCNGFLDGMPRRLTLHTALLRTGIMLIDRNDELCVLYEKANIQEEVIKGGQLELRRRDDEARCAPSRRTLD